MYVAAAFVIGALIGAASIIFLEDMGYWWPRQ